MPRIYVGTYAKYNNGSIKGQWLDLEDYSDMDAFLEACATLHADESDPEFMFQDFEGFPKSLYSESAVSDALWDWLELDEDDHELLAVYQYEVNRSADIEEAREAFMGKYDSPEDWAAEYIADSGMLSEVPDSLRNYIDYAAYARDARCDGMSFVELGYRKCWVFNC